MIDQAALCTLQCVCVCVRLLCQERGTKIPNNQLDRALERETETETQMYTRRPRGKSEEVKRRTEM